MITATPRPSFFVRSSILTALTIVLFGVSGTASFAAKAKKVSADNTYSIREKCVKQAQAAYPENGYPTQSLIPQRTGVYRDCAFTNGIRP